MSSVRINVDPLADKSLQNSVTAVSSASPLSTFKHSQPSADITHPDQPALSTTSAANHLQAQYSQFLASVRDFKPLVADLNASIASVANTVSTMGAGVSVSCVSNGAVGASQQYVGDVVLHSPVSQRDPTLAVSEHVRHSHVSCKDNVSQNHGEFQMCIVFW